MTGTDRRFALLVNPTAGGGRASRVVEDASAILGQVDASYRILSSESSSHLKSLVGEAIRAGEMPVAVGGDGTLACVVRELSGSSTPVGLLPAGRGNDFARTVGIPTNPRASALNLVQGTDTAFDLGEANGQIFLGIASFGFDSDANRIANESSLITGGLVYLYAGLRAALGWKSATFQIAIDGSLVREIVGWTVAVANSRAYGGGMFIAPDADLTDGELDLVTIADSGKLRFLANMPRVFKGTHVQSPLVEVVRAREVEVDADRPFDVYADGDLLTSLPLRARVIKGGLLMRVPIQGGS